MAANDGQAYLLVGQREGAHSDERVVEAGHHRPPRRKSTGSGTRDKRACPAWSRASPIKPVFPAVYNRRPHHLHVLHDEGVGVICLERINDLLAALIERTLVVLLRQADEHLVPAGVIDGLDGLDGRILDARRIHGPADTVDVRGPRELRLHLRAALEVHAEEHRAANALPMHTHGDNAGHAEDQRKGEEVPLQLSASPHLRREKIPLVLSASWVRNSHRLRLLMFSAALGQFAPKKLDGHLLALPQLVQMGIENDPRDKDCREQVGQQTDGQGGCKALYRAGAKQNRMAAETMVVTWVSTMVTQA